MKIRIFGIAFLLFGFNLSFAKCPAPLDFELVTVQRIIDGDTIHLTDQRKVRMLGINAPELAKKGVKNSTDEPFALEAKALLQKLIQAQNFQIKLQQGKNAKDRYGRILAHTYSLDGVNFEEQLVQAGLAYRTAFVPNTQLDSCLLEAEKSARTKKRNLWRKSPIITPAQIKSGGFALVKTTISKVYIQQCGTLRLETNAGIVFKISPKVQKKADQHTVEQIKRLGGKQIVARGWVVDRAKFKNPPKSGRWLMNISAVSMLEL